MIEETIVAVVADHGGYRNTHGITPPFAAEIYVPLLIRGRKNKGREGKGRDLIDCFYLKKLTMNVFSRTWGEEREHGGLWIS